MELNSIINNSNLTNKIQDIYKYIDKNASKFNTIFDRAYAEIKHLYPVELHDNTLEVTSTGSLLSDKEKCEMVLEHHADDVLGENGYLVAYAFKVNTIDNMVVISKKR